MRSRITIGQKLWRAVSLALLTLMPTLTVLYVAMDWMHQRNDVYNLMDVRTSNVGRFEVRAETAFRSHWSEQGYSEYSRDGMWSHRPGGVSVIWSGKMLEPHAIPNLPAIKFDDPTQQPTHGSIFKRQLWGIRGPGDFVSNRTFVASWLVETRPGTMTPDELKSAAVFGSFYQFELRVTYRFLLVVILAVLLILLTFRSMRSACRWWLGLPVRAAAGAWRRMVDPFHTSPPRGFEVVTPDRTAPPHPDKNTPA